MLESLHMAYWDTKQQDKLPTLIARASWIFDQFEKCKKYYEQVQGQKEPIRVTRQSESNGFPRATADNGGFIKFTTVSGDNTEIMDVG